MYGSSPSSCGATSPTTDPAIRIVAPSSTAAAAIGGRFGPSRTTSSRASTTRTGRPSSSASSRAACGAIERSLPPNAPPFASGVAGSRPGSHHDASGSRYAGSTHDVASRTPASGRGGSASGGRLASVVRRPWTFPASARASISDGATTHRCPVVAGTATVQSAGAVSSAKPPSPSGTSSPTRCSTPPSSAARRAAASRSRTGYAKGPPDAASRIASRTVFHPVQRHRCAASMRSTDAASTDPRSINHAARTTMPGVQKPHCEPPDATNAVASRSRTSGASPSTVVTERPRRGSRASRTPRGVRRRRGRCSSRTDPAARTRPSPSGSRGRRAGRRAASHRGRWPGRPACRRR